jgi:hypothetical protein
MAASTHKGDCHKVLDLVNSLILRRYIHLFVCCFLIVFYLNFMWYFSFDFRCPFEDVTEVKYTLDVAMKYNTQWYM